MRNTGSFFILFVLVITTFGCAGGEADLSSERVAERVTAQPSRDGIVGDSPGEKAPAANTPVATTVSQTFDPKRAAPEKISLEQGRTSTIDTAPADRKIVRNAEL